MLRLRRLHNLQKFVSVHPSVRNLFSTEPSLSSRTVCKGARPAAVAEWRQPCADGRQVSIPKARRVRIRLTAPAHGMRALIADLEADPPAFDAPALAPLDPASVRVEDAVARALEPAPAP